LKPEFDSLDFCSHIAIKWLSPPPLARNGDDLIYCRVTFYEGFEMLLDNPCQVTFGAGLANGNSKRPTVHNIAESREPYENNTVRRLRFHGMISPWLLSHRRNVQE